MRKTTLKNAQERLLEMKRQIMREISDDLKHGREGAKDDGMDTYDLASEERDREINFILSDREREKLQSIDEASSGSRTAATGSARAARRRSPRHGSRRCPSRACASVARPSARRRRSCRVNSTTNGRIAVSPRPTSTRKTPEPRAVAGNRRNLTLSSRSGMGARRARKPAMAEPPSVARTHLGRIFEAAVRAVEPSQPRPAPPAPRGGGDRPSKPPGWSGRAPRRSSERERPPPAWLRAARQPSGPKMSVGSWSFRREPGLASASIRALQASHPCRTERAVEATEEICRLLESGAGGPVLCLISGGASSLLVRPRAPLTLDDKQRTTGCCSLRVPASTRRTRSESISPRSKAAGLLALRQAAADRQLDPVGRRRRRPQRDRLGPDGRRSDDLLRTRSRCWLDSASKARAPPAVRALLERGTRGEMPETVKPGGCRARAR